jgi:hypothetical protein
MRRNEGPPATWTTFSREETAYLLNEVAELAESNEHFLREAGATDFTGFSALPAYIIYNVAKDLGGALALHEMLVYHGHPDFRDVINVIADRLEPAIRALNGYPAY